MFERKEYSRVSSALPRAKWDGFRSTALGAEALRLRSLYAVAPRAVEEPLVVRGFAEVAAYKPLLIELAQVTGQAGAMDDVDYFLSTPDAVKKIPHLVLRRSRGGEAGARGCSGATLLFEYRTPGYGAGFGTRVFATADATGRRTVLASVERRASVAADAARTLMRRGAQVVHVAFQAPQEKRAENTVGGELAGGLAGGPRGAVWSLMERSMAMYLPLERTFDLTLARIGRRTRYNLRYYRRRTERDLGCTYVPEAKVGLEEFLAMNRACKYAVPDELARWRYQSLQVAARPLFCGIKDRDGLWLSLVGGRRREGEVEIDWQMNREGLELYSLSTVVRSCLIEQEVTRGTQRLYLEGGTPHAIGNSFTRERVAELTVKRSSIYVGLLERLASRLSPPKNYLAQVLQNAELEWHSV